MTRSTSNPVSNKPHLRLRPWPEHDVPYLDRGWVVYDSFHGDRNSKAIVWAIHWNYDHRKLPAPGERPERFG